MPRQTRRLPVQITRFNYWNYGPCRPRSRDELERLCRHRIHDPADDEGEVLFRFLRHLQHGPCDEPTCLLQSADTSQWPELALDDFIRRERRWERYAAALRVFKELPAGVRQRLLRIDARLYGRVGRRSWSTLLQAIAKDQRLFARMLPSGAKPGAKPGAKRIMVEDERSYPSARKVWTAYARQALDVLGQNPEGETARLGGGRQRARLDLTGLEGNKREWILHWFAHAFRNLVRYRGGRSSLPFEESCIIDCKHRLDRF